MAKLRDLVFHLSHSLDMKEASLNVLAMQLRKAGLITSSGRGLNAADMGPSDVTNLLLAALSGSYATLSAESVSKLRTAPIIDCRLNGEPSGLPPTPAFSRLPGSHTLGEILDELIKDFGQFEDIPVERSSGGVLTAMTFEISRTRRKWTAEFWFDDDSDDKGWTVRYKCERPTEEDEFFPHKPKAPMRFTSDMVNMDLFYEAAHLIVRDGTSGPDG